MRSVDLLGAPADTRERCAGRRMFGRLCGKMPRGLSVLRPRLSASRGASPARPSPSSRPVARAPPATSHLLRAPSATAEAAPAPSPLPVTSTTTLALPADPPPPPEPEPLRARFLSVGDVIFGRRIAKVIARKGDPDHPFRPLAKLYADVDFTFANLQTPSRPRRNPTRRPPESATPSCGRAPRASSRSSNTSSPP